MMTQQSDDIMNQEIARELMLEINPDLSQQQFERVWSLCNGNPWNAGVLYQILELAK